MTDDADSPWQRTRRRLRELFGRGGGPVADLLVDQVELVLDAARQVRDDLVDGVAAAHLRNELDDRARRADEVRDAVQEATTRALVTPIDAEDIARVSRSVEDVMDNLADLAVELDRYEVSDRDRLVPLVAALVDGLQALARAIRQVGEDPTDVLGRAREARRANEVRRAYHDQMADLLAADRVTAQLLAEREVLRRLDVAGLRLAEAADALVSGALKRR